jgi:hypothetical protein
MVVDLIRVLIEAAEGIYLIVSAVCDRGIYKAGGALWFDTKWLEIVF